MGTQRQGRQGPRKEPTAQADSQCRNLNGRGGITDPRDGLGNTTPHIVYKFE